jgi:outer membrane cobalamin receptor
LDAVTVKGTLGYNRYGTNFYGQTFDQSGTTLLNTTPDKQTFTDIYLNGELSSNVDPKNEQALSYSAKVDGYLFKDAYKAKENSIALSGYLNKRLSAFNVGANLSVTMNNVKDSAEVKNHLAVINPYIRFKGDNYNVTLGANLTSEFGDSSRFNIFPSVEADFALAPEYISLFAGINGGVKQASFRSFAKENPYLAPNAKMINSIEKMNVYAGLKGNAGATFGYKVKVFYKQIEGLPLFKNSAFGDSQNGYVPWAFDVVYDGVINKAKHMGLEGEINVRLSQLVNLGGKVYIDDYKLSDEEEAWGLPKFRMQANARFNISDKFFVDAELSTQGNTYAYIYDYNTDGSRIANSGHKATIGSFADLNAGAEYRIKKQFGIFVKANNIFGKEYERYMYYPRLGFNVIGGLNYSF